MSDNGAMSPVAACSAAGNNSDSGCSRSRSDGASGIAGTSAAAAAVTSRTDSNNHSSKKRMPILIHTPRGNVTQSKDADKSSYMRNLHNEGIFHEEQHVQQRLAAVAGALTANDGTGPPLSKGYCDYKGHNDNGTNNNMNVMANAAALAAAKEAKVGDQGGGEDHRQLRITAASASSALPPPEQKSTLDVMLCNVASSHGDNPVAPPSTESAEKEMAQEDETKMETKIKGADEDVADAAVVAANPTADTVRTTITATDDHNAVVDCASSRLSDFVSLSQSPGKEHSEKWEQPSQLLQRPKEVGLLFNAKRSKIDASSPNNSRAVAKTISQVGMVRVVVYVYK
jgi:hypothetical protein